MRPEMRRNLLSGAWVVYAPGRKERPHDLKNGKRGRGSSGTRPEYDCPFCPGNESQLVDIILELPGDEGALWKTRVVPNKFPAFLPDVGNPESDDKNEGGAAVFKRCDAVGMHEVIVETPRHGDHASTFSKEQMSAILATYQSRYMTLSAAHRLGRISIFRNHGQAAGTSLAHPHSQLIWTEVVPELIRAREARALAYYNRHKSDLVGDLLSHELDTHLRIINTNDSFTSMVPYWACPYEIWIVPSTRQADFGDLTPEAREDLASLLQDALRRLYIVLGDPDYNMVVNTAGREQSDCHHLRWFIEIRPRLSNSAGFEIATGIRIHSSLPEENAESLRNCK